MSVGFEVILDRDTGEPIRVGIVRGDAPAAGIIEGTNQERIYINDSTISMDEFLNTKYKRLDDFSTWHTRTVCPGAFYDWDTSTYSWVVNTTRMWVSGRADRDQALNLSDWTQMPDSPLTSEKKAEWATYRQALRDLPSTQSSATTWADITWPTAPS
tara:strand:- start:517 stop:987 length:471 start_codon:yes stop_codon:yes gene_type:complete